MNRPLKAATAVLALAGTALLIGLAPGHDASGDSALSVQVAMYLRDDGVNTRVVDCSAEQHYCAVTLTTGRTIGVRVDRYEDGSWNLAREDRP
jgi:hypothetical protein